MLYICSTWNSERMYTLYWSKMNCEKMCQLKNSKYCVSPFSPCCLFSFAFFSFPAFWESGWNIINKTGQVLVIKSPKCETYFISSLLCWSSILKLKHVRLLLQISIMASICKSIYSGQLMYFHECSITGLQHGTINQVFYSILLFHPISFSGSGFA